MPRASIFEFDDPIAYLSAMHEEKKRLEARHSLRSWSRQIGLRNPSLLSELLRRRRQLKPALAARLAHTLDLEGDEKRYFDLLVLRESARTDSERELHAELLEKLKPQRSCYRLDPDRFRLLADWYHLVLLEMLELKDFRYDPDFLARKLGDGVSAATVAAALQRLARLGLIDVEPDGRVLRRRGHPHTGDRVPSGAIRRHHRQMIDRAKAALVRQPIAVRDIRGSTLALRAEDYDRAVEIVRECHRRLQKLEALGSGDFVYRLNTQFFRMTDEEK